MAGGSQTHNDLVNNLSDFLSVRKLRSNSCFKFNSDMKVHLREDHRFCYPDLTVCGEPVFEDDWKDVLTNPTAVFEVLSPTTMSYDIGDNSFYYRRNAALRHILLIWHDRVKVGHWLRTSGAEPWTYTEYGDVSDVAALPEVSVALPVSEIYSGVSF